MAKFCIYLSVHASIGQVEDQSNMMTLQGTLNESKTLSTVQDDYVAVKKMLKESMKKMFDNLGDNIVVIDNTDEDYNIESQKLLSEEKPNE